MATILAGNSESLIAKAIGGTGHWVDRVLLIDTGITDNTLSIARDLAGAQLHVEDLAWRNDFAEARNFALAKAAALGASWALTVDTDERLSFPGFKSRDELQRALDSDPEVLVWLVPCRDGSYAKERFVRVPTRLVWKGRTHEALVGAGEKQRRILRGAEFFEEPKTPEQFRAKLLRDLEVLRVETQDKPDNPRWWYYLGQTLEELQEHREAAEAYGRCYELRGGWAEQAAWACFRAAACRLRLDELQRALEICTLGLARQRLRPFPQQELDLRNCHVINRGQRPVASSILDLIKGVPHACRFAGLVGRSHGTAVSKSMGGGGSLAPSADDGGLGISICVAARCWSVTSRAWCCLRRRCGRTRTTRWT